MSGSTAVCTIASANYLARVRVLMESLARWHPEWERYVLLLDRIDGRIGLESEPFRVVPLEDLPISGLRRLCFRYSQLELATAVKPPLLRHLFDGAGCERVVYLDPDVQLLAPLDEVERALDGGALLCLTPHVFEPPTDEWEPSAETLRRAGRFNLGFAALARHSALEAFLSWWWSKTEHDCRVDFARGLFLDQRCLDEAPTRFPDVEVLDHRGYNVAYWNLAERPVTKDPSAAPSGYRAGPDPLVFFHFSGYEPSRPEILSRFQDRFDRRGVGAAAALFDAYRDAVLAAGQDEVCGLAHAFDRFEDGTPVVAEVRSLYSKSDAVRKDAGDDPFALGADYFNAPFDGDGERPLVSRLVYAIWCERSELRRAFPDPGGASRTDLAWWFVHRVAAEHALPEVYVAPVRDSLRSSRVSLRLWLLSGMARAADALRPAGHVLSPTSKAWLRRLLQPLSGS